MSGKKSIVVIVAIVLIIIAFGAVSVSYNQLPAESEFVLDIEEVRRLANSPVKKLPRAINSLLVAEGDFPSCLVIAGCAEQSYPFQFRVFEIDYGFNTVILDPVHDLDLHKANEPLMAAYYPDQYDRMQQALKKAALILVTHEHFDHIGGLVKSPYLEDLLPKIRLNKEQLNSKAAQMMEYPEVMQKITLLPDQPYIRIVPGVVLIAAPGHTPGSQMIFVKLQSGEELLFVGDTVWDMDNIEQKKSKPLLTNWIVGEDGKQLSHQIRKLIDLHESGVKLVVSHDKEQLAAYIRDGIIRDGLSD